jgi:proline dehydrogenase
LPPTTTTTPQVRGAYLNLERRRAQQRRYPSPIWDTLQQTHDNFDACVADVLDEVRGCGRVG